MANFSPKKSRKKWIYMRKEIPKFSQLFSQNNDKICQEKTLVPLYAMYNVKIIHSIGVIKILIHFFEDCYLSSESLISFMLHNLVKYFMWGVAFNLDNTNTLLYINCLFSKFSINKCSLFIARWKYKLGASVALTLSHSPFTNLPQVDQHKISTIGKKIMQALDRGAPHKWWCKYLFKTIKIDPSVFSHNLGFVYKTHGLNACLACKEDEARSRLKMQRD